MSASVLVDTSFLISLVDEHRPHHSIATQYYRLALEQKAPLYLSAIVASEFAIKQPITDLPLRQFRILPFNIPHAIRAAELWRLIERDDGDNRSVVRDDMKLLAQAAKESIPIVLTEDAKTLHKYCDRLRHPRRDSGADGSVGGRIRSERSARRWAARVEFYRFSNVAGLQ